MTKVGLPEAQRRGTYLRNGLVREMRPKPWLSNEPELGKGGRGQYGLSGRGGAICTKSTEAKDTW